MAYIMGQTTHNLDPKNRLAMPSKMVEELGDTFVLYVPQNGDRCLFAYAMEDWRELMDKLNERATSRSLTLQQRFVHLYSTRVEADKQGRFTIPAHFVEAANLEREVFILGAGKRVELWNPDEFAKMQAAYENEEEAQKFDLAY